MPSPSAIRAWYLVHKWTSLVCTLFLLLLCITGLPLIFHHEIDDWTDETKLPLLAAGTPHASTDESVATARAVRPGQAVQFVFWDPDKPDKVSVSMAATPTAQEDIHVASIDARTGRLLSTEKADEGVMAFIFKLHVEMFAGLPGKLFLGFMGLLFMASVVSGVVVYGPFMRKLAFGTVRRDRSPRLKWLDLHNLLGIAVVCWVLVVGFTGVLNTWADLVIKFWQFDQLAAMVAPYKDRAPLKPEQFGSVDVALRSAQAATPSMKPAFVAFPGTLFSSQHNYAVFMRGTTPLTARLLKPALIDAQTGQLTDSRELPWYVTALLVSQPLHFGDYGGMPFKILWAVLDVIAIIVLGSGVYLWLGRRRRPLEQRVAEVLAGGEQEEAASKIGGAA